MHRTWQVMGACARRGPTPRLRLEAEAPSIRTRTSTGACLERPHGVIGSVGSARSATVGAAGPHPLTPPVFPAHTVTPIVGHPPRGFRCHYRLLFMASVTLRACACRTDHCHSTLPLLQVVRGHTTCHDEVRVGCVFLFIELYVFPFAGNLTVAWSRVRRGGRYVTGQTRVGPGARRWAGFGIVIRARDRGRRSAGAAVT